MMPEELPPIPAPPDENLMQALLEEVASWGWVHQGQAEWQRVADGAEGLALLQAAAEEFPEPAAPAEAPDRPDPAAQAHIAAGHEAQVRTERENEGQRAYAERELVRQPARLRWPQQKPAFPRANEDEARRLIRRYIRQLIGPLPWVRRVFPCTVTAVDRTAKTCTVTFAERGAAEPLPGVGYGAQAPVVGGEYALRWPAKLPDDPDIPAQPRLYGRPWIKSTGFVRWLYYTSRTDGALTRVQWPITDESEPETVAPGRSAQGWHEQSRTLWTNTGREGQANTQYTAFAEWGFGAAQTTATGREIIGVSQTVDHGQAEDDAVWLAGWEPIPAPHPQFPSSTYNDRQRLVRSGDGGATWATVAELDYLNLITNVLVVNVAVGRCQHGWVLPAEVPALGPAGTPLLPIPVWTAEPPPSDGDMHTPWRLDLWLVTPTGVQLWTPPAPEDTTPPGWRVGLTPYPEADAPDQWQVWCTVDVVPAEPTLPGIPPDPRLYRGRAALLAPPAWELMTAPGTLRGHLTEIVTVSPDGLAAVAAGEDAANVSRFWATEDAGDTWTLLPLPLNADMAAPLLVDIPGGDARAEYQDAQ